MSDHSRHHLHHEHSHGLVHHSIKRSREGVRAVAPWRTVRGGEHDHDHPGHEPVAP
jgi:hypothetical protein